MSKALLDMGISFPKVGWGRHGARRSPAIPGLFGKLLVPAARGLAKALGLTAETGFFSWMGAGLEAWNRRAVPESHQLLYFFALQVMPAGKPNCNLANPFLSASLHHWFWWRRPEQVFGDLGIPKWSNQTIGCAMFYLSSLTHHYNWPSFTKPTNYFKIILYGTRCNSEIHSPSSSIFVKPNVHVTHLCAALSTPPVAYSWPYLSRQFIPVLVML